MNWEVLGNIPPEELVEARLQAHWAAQLVAAVGSGLVAPAPDDSQTSLRWRVAERTFYGAMTPHRFAAALRPEALSVLLTLPTGTPLRELELPGRTFEEALNWVNDSIAGVTGSAPEPRLERPDYFMEDHPLITDGAKFSFDTVLQLGELTQWFANAASLLETIQGENRTASPVRVWPHHFDIATLIVIDPDETNPDRVRSINVGMSPGDLSYEMPYYYINPWPTPQDAALPELEGAGDWHTAGWLGAVLTAADVVHVDDAELQGRAVMTHIRSSIAACRTLLGAPEGGSDPDGSALG